MSLSTTLSSFNERDLTVRIVSGLLGILPFVPAWHHPGALEALAARHPASNGGALAARIAARADALAQAPGPQAALKAFDFLDKGDTGIALFSGLKGAVNLYQGDKSAALELDPQQAADAGLKVLGVAYAAYKLLPGSPQEKVKALLATDSGAALLAWFVAVDVVIPFTDNLLTGGLDVTNTLIEKYAAENADKLSLVAGGELEQAKGMLQALTEQVRALVGQAARFAQPLTQWSQERLPNLLGTADKVSGLVATGLDALHAYRYLGAALVAEVVLAQAAAEVSAEVAAEAAAAARAKAEAEAQARAAAEARARAEEEARQRSAQQENYSLGAAVAADSQRLNPVKVTRSGGDTAPVKKGGCMGCGALLLFGVMGGGASGVAALVHWLA